MNRTVHAFSPQGTLRIQPSKSVLHRALICAALANGRSEIENFARSEDIDATMRVLEDLGFASFDARDGVCIVQGDLNETPRTALDCGESGTTLRLLFPLALDGHEYVIYGHGRLMERPFGPYEELCKAQGIELVRGEHEIRVCGRLHDGSVRMPGNVSSQFISGLLFGFARTRGESEIHLTSPLESAPYVEITRSVLSAFGVATEQDGGVFRVSGVQQFQPRSFYVEGDHSHAAFFAAAAALGGDVTLEGLLENTPQGDRAIFNILNEAGAETAWEKTQVRVRRGELLPFDADVSQTPDLVPVLAALACGARGTSTLRNAARLRLKESDRLSAMRTELEKLGANVREEPDALIIEGTGQLHGGKVDSHGDHRVVMALCVASLLSDEPVEIEGAEAVSKSAPKFFDEWKAIGGGDL